MDVRKIGLDRGWGLYARGWKAFRADPVSWILALIVFVVISFVLNLIPLLGALALVVLSPALIAGFLALAHDLEGGRKGGVGHLFLPLQDPERRLPLLLLGLVALGLGVFAALVVGVSLGGAIVLSGNAGPGSVIGGVGLFGVLLVFLLYLAVFAALAFAVPLVYFRGTGISDAITASVRGTLANLGPLVIFSLIYLILAVLAAIPLGLGFLVLGPVVLAAMYGAYSEIFAESQPVSGETA